METPDFVSWQPDDVFRELLPTYTTLLCLYNYECSWQIGFRICGKLATDDAAHTVSK